jgi:hypothetical protein
MVYNHPVWFAKSKPDSGERRFCQRADCRYVGPHELVAKTSDWAGWRCPKCGCISTITKAQ